MNIEQSVKKFDVKHKSRFYNLRILLLLAFVASLPYEYWDPIGIRGSFTISKFFGLLYTIFVLFDAKKNILRIISKNKNIVYSAFLLWFWIFLVTLFKTTVYYNNSPFVFSILQVVILFILVFYEVENNHHIKSKIYIVFILSLFSTAILLSAGIGIENSLGANIEDIESTRVYFMGMNPNGLGSMASISVVLVLSLVFHENNFGKWKYLLLVSLPNLLFLIGISGSRGAFFTLFIGLFILFAFKGKFSLKKLSYLLLGVVVGFIIINYLAEFEKLQGRILETYETGATGGRLELWKLALDIFNKNPFTGFGLEGMQIELGKLTSFNTSHNVFIDFALMGGIIGLILYSNIIWTILKKSVRFLKVNNNTVNLAIFAMILFLLLKSGGGYTSKMMWMMLATIAPLYKNKKQTI